MCIFFYNVSKKKLYTNLPTVAFFSSTLRVNISDEDTEQECKDLSWETYRSQSMVLGWGNLCSLLCFSREKGCYGQG